MTALRPALSLVLALVVGAWSVEMRAPMRSAAAPMPCHSEPGEAPMPGMEGGKRAPAEAPGAAPAPGAPSPDGSKPEAPAPLHCSPGSACPLCVALSTPALLPLRAPGLVPLALPRPAVLHDGRPAEPPTPPPRRA